VRFVFGYHFDRCKIAEALIERPAGEFMDYVRMIANTGTGAELVSSAIWLSVTPLLQ
jgi:hypothetical protein